MGCDMCGKEGQLFKALIERTELTVCKKCGDHGKILRKISPPKPAIKKTIEAKKEIIETITSDYSKKVRNAREKLGMTQEEFAKKIKEKESVVHKIETGIFEPSIPLAKKLGKILHIKLIETLEEETAPVAKGKSTALTIGDLLNSKG